MIVQFGAKSKVNIINKIIVRGQDAWINQRTNIFTSTCGGGLKLMRRIWKEGYEVHKWTMTFRGKKTIDKCFSPTLQWSRDMFTTLKLNKFNNNLEISYGVIVSVLIVSKASVD